MLDKLERVFGRFALPNATLYIIVGQVFVALTALLGLLDLRQFVLVPILVTHGEPWRVLTFIFFPPPVNFSSMLSVALLPFAWWIFFLMGNALEHEWGVFRYNLFLLAGCLLTIGAAWLNPLSPVTNAFIAGSVFLAFAWLNPDFELAIFFILPLKIKWLALLTWVLYAVGFVTGGWPTRWQILASVGNFLLFFGRDIYLTVRHRRRQIARRVVAETAGPEHRHRCHVCGKTDVTDPALDFRYCSKCAGDQCYCPEHIFSHEHVLTDGENKKVQ
jgi:Pyruvate/2-oxoacid:ferredoxin oxidoreductase delta subunit